MKTAIASEKQCLEIVLRDENLKNSGLCYQTFAALLVEDPPLPVKEKLKKWGVADYKSIFSRALGLNAIFNDVPERHKLTEEFIRHYYRYADPNGYGFHRVYTERRDETVRVTHGDVVAVLYADADGVRHHCTFCRVLGAGEDVSWMSQSVCRLPWPGVCAYKKTGG